MSFSPARSNPDSMSMSPSNTPDASPQKQSAEIQSTKWPPSPEDLQSAAAAEIVAEAKAKISRWSEHFQADSDSEDKPVSAPAKTKFVPKVAARFDSRQAALNKLAAKRIALAKSKAKAGLSFNSKLSSPSKIEDTKASVTRTDDSASSSSIQISLSSFANKFSTAGGSTSAGNEKPTASIAPIMSSTSSQPPAPAVHSLPPVTSTQQLPVSIDNIPAPSTVTATMTPSVKPNDTSNKVAHVPQPSSSMIQAMQATLVSHDSHTTTALTADTARQITAEVSTGE